jgi:hypothetical protein
MKKDIKIWLGAGIIGLLITGVAAWWSVAQPSESAVSTASTTQRSNSSLTTAGSATATSTTSIPTPINSQAVTPVHWVFPPPAQPTTKVVEMTPGVPVSDPSQVQAQVKVGNTVYRLVPNDNGYFGQIDIPAKQKMNVQVYEPNGQAGDNYIVQVEDGGSLLGQRFQGAQAAPLNDAQELNFQYQVSNQPGIYRVVLRSGGDVSVLNFWVGPELPVATAR